MSNSISDSPNLAQPKTVESQAETVNVKVAEAYRRLPVNILSNAAWLGVNLLVGFWYTPYMIKNLGVAVYGLIPLASSITNYLALVTDGYASAVSRFLQIDLARDDAHAANRTFNTAIAGSLTILTFLIPIAILGSWLVPQIFHIPAGQERSAQWLVLLTMLAFAITFFTGSFAVSSFATHRFDLRQCVNLVRLAVQMGSIVILFTLLSPQLWEVGVGIFLSSLILLLGHSLLWRRLTPQLAIKPRLFQISRLKQLLKFSGWVLVNQAGTQLFLNIDLVVANLVFGAYVAGRYGAVVIFPLFLRATLGTLGSVMEPIIFTLYAQNDLSGLLRFCNLAVKFAGLALALPIGLICGFAKPLLAVWLGPQFSDLSWLVVVLVGQLCINLAVVPLFPIQQAANRVRVPGIVTLGTGVINACLAISLALGSGWGYISIAIAGATVNTARNILFTPPYAARCLELPWHTFLPRLLYGVVGSVAVGVVAFWAASTWTLTSWGQLALMAMIMSGLYIVVVYFLGFDASERKLLEAEIRRRLKK
jgi:O-antigen/teichoic acid export membrane protein